MSHEHRGAYGFRLIYPEDGDHLIDLVDVGPSAPAVRVGWSHASPFEDFTEFGDERAAIGVRRGSGVFVERDPPSIQFILAQPPKPAALVHPLLTVAISILTRWRGDVTVHAGAFETPTGAWGVVGGRLAGKSATLAVLAERGYPVVADDLLSIQDGWVWAGPNCVDLRPDTAQYFQSARDLGVIGDRPRFRLSTPPSSARVPLRGIFVLEWHDRPGFEAELVPLAERLHLLYRQEYFPLVGGPDPTALLPLLGLPVWRVSRTRDWNATDEVVQGILERAV